MNDLDATTSARVDDTSTGTSGSGAGVATAAAQSVAPAQHGLFVRVTRRMVLSQMRALERGHLTIIEEGETLECGDLSAPEELRAVIRVHDIETWMLVALRGSVGAAEAFMHGQWSTPDLVRVVRVMVANRKVLDGMEDSLARFIMPLWKVAHWVHRNNRKGSRRNIAAHYDLGNDFFRLFLDETMMYSAGIFERPGASLHEAQVAKNDRICRKLDLKPTDHLVEIGTGWGGFAIHAAKNYGCRITTTTISQEQFDLAQARVRAAGLESKIQIVKEDYRDLRGSFDKLVSIEMIEAVGHQYYPDYFGTVGRLLKPDGMALIQAITIADQVYEAALGNVDFIQKYIFPGSCIPSITAMMQAVSTSSDLKLYHLEDITPHYADTLKIWRENLLARKADAQRMGLGEVFLRMWEYYFSYCEGGFRERAIGDVQMLLIKPLCRRDAIVPQLDALDRSNRVSF